MKSRVESHLSILSIEKSYLREIRVQTMKDQFLRTLNAANAGFDQRSSLHESKFTLNSAFFKASPVRKLDTCSKSKSRQSLEAAQIDRWRRVLAPEYISQFPAVNLISN